MELGVRSLPANAENVRDASLIPGLGRSPGVGNGNPLQYSCLENPTDRGAWKATVHRIAKGRTRLKWLGIEHTIIFHCMNRPHFVHPCIYWYGLFHFLAIVNFATMNIHIQTKVLFFYQGAKIFFKFIRLFKKKKSFWRKKWQSTPAFLLGKSHGQRSLASYSSWGHNWVAKHKDHLMDSCLSVISYEWLDIRSFLRSIKIYFRKLKKTHVNFSILQLTRYKKTTF